MPKPALRKPTKADPVNSPAHYASSKIEVIEYLQDKLSPEEYKGFLKGNVLKYLSRATLKGAEEQDYQKAQWYLNKLVEITK